MARYNISGEMGGGGVGPSFMRNRKTSFQQEEKKQGEPLTESAGRLGRFGKTMGEEKKDENAVQRLQRFAKEENERKRKKKEEEEKAKKAGGVAPSKGFLERMYDYWFPAKESK